MPGVLNSMAGCPKPTHHQTAVIGSCSYLLTILKSNFLFPLWGRLARDIRCPLERKSSNSVGPRISTSLLSESRHRQLDMCRIFTGLHLGTLAREIQKSSTMFHLVAHVMRSEDECYKYLRLNTSHAPYDRRADKVTMSRASYPA